VASALVGVCDPPHPASNTAAMPVLSAQRPKPELLI
jgi:hypothetical protein